MGEPIRHSANARNRRKALHQAKDVRDEASYLLSEINRLKTNYEYLFSSACKLVNRLEAESHHDDTGSHR